MKIILLNESASLLKGSERLVVIGTEEFFKKEKVWSGYLPEGALALIKNGVKTLVSGANGTVYKTFTSDVHVKEVALVVLPDEVSRYNSPSRKQYIFQHTQSLSTGRPTSIVLALEDAHYLQGALNGIARLENRTTYKSKTTPKTAKAEKPAEQTLKVLSIDHAGKVLKPSEAVIASMEGVAWAAALVDRAPSELNPEVFAKEIKAHFKDTPQVKISEFVGEDLIKNGLRGMYAVGQAATKAPRMIVLHYKPKTAKKVVALVGKGLTYDSGGLSLKISGSMVGMKGDMGGAAAVLGAFHTLVHSHCKNEVIAVCGIVENAIGPEAYKNDDVLVMHSGKTVEVNNTDAEGRIVLADALSWVARKYSPKLIINAATLTGAQLVATGLLHAAIVSNDEKTEKEAIELGKITGDLVHPLIFAPEIFTDEFKSAIADMKNSVKNRTNSPSSAAGQFLWSHIDDIKGLKWLHIDLAGPASYGDNRGTGFGVALISELARQS